MAKQKLTEASKLLRRREKWPEGVPLPPIGAFSGNSLWTYDEEQSLRKYYPMYGHQYCMRLLGRTKQAVYKKAVQIGAIVTTKLSPPWTKAEDNRLRKLYGTMPKQQIARLLGRTVVAIQIRTQKLGLKSRPPRWSAAELALLRKHYGKMDNATLAQMIGRPRTSMMVLARRLSLSTPRVPATPEQVKYVLENTGKIAAAQIRRHTGLSQFKVRRILARKGVKALSLIPNFITPDEDAYIKKNYSVMTVKMIAKHLGRSQKGITDRALALGLRKENSYTVQNTYWSKKQDALLRKLFRKIPHTEIAEKLGRTVKAISTRISVLGLYAELAPKTRWTKKNDQVLRQLYNQVSPFTLASRLGLSVKQVQYRMQVLGLKTPDRLLPHPWTEKEKQTLRRLYTTIPSAELVRQLGRSRESIYVQAGKLGLRKNSLEYRLWSAADDAMLKTLYEKKMKYPQIAIKLTRTERAVKVRLWQLKLTSQSNRMPAKWTLEEDALLRKHYGKKRVSDIATQLNRTPVAVQIRITKLKLHQG